MEKEIVGLPTGFKALDEKLGGLRKGEVVVIASRPSVGKTSLAMNVVKELMVPVVVLVQLFKRFDEAELPTLSDLRDVAVIEENADIVMFLRRIPPYYDSEIKASEEDVAILDIAKNRKGETGEVKMTFSREFMRFGNAIEGREG